VGQIGLPFSESGSIHVFGLALPLEADSTIVASVTPALSLGGALNLKVEEIAPSDEVAASQAGSLTSLVNLARGFAAPLGEDSPGNGLANRGLKQLLKSAEVTIERRNRVVVKATLSPALLTSLAQDEDSAREGAQGSAPAPSH